MNDDDDDDGFVYWVIASISSMLEKKRKIVHWPGIEPGPPAWQARILPLNHQCPRD